MNKIKKTNKIEKSDFEYCLNELILKGDILITCPHCSNYLNYNEWKILKCSTCKRKITSGEVRCSTGPEKENN